MTSLRFFAPIFSLCVAGLIPPTAQAQSTARPELKVGDTWTVLVTSSSGVAGAARREEVRVVKEAGETGYQVENTKKDGAGAPTVEMITLSRDLNFIGPAGAGGSPQEFKWLQWPLEPGRAYQYEVTTASQQVITWKGKVTGWKEIEVPAGKFKALYAEFDRSGPFRGSASEVIWYSPEAKSVVKRIQSRPGMQGAPDVTTYELVSYKLN